MAPPLVIGSRNKPARGRTSSAPADSEPNQNTKGVQIFLRWDRSFAVGGDYRIQSTIDDPSHPALILMRLRFSSHSSRCSLVIAIHFSFAMIAGAILENAIQSLVLHGSASTDRARPSSIRWKTIAWTRRPGAKDNMSPCCSCVIRSTRCEKGNILHQRSIGICNGASQCARLFRLP
jgi:hypothetical protein